MTDPLIALAILGAVLTAYFLPALIGSKRGVSASGWLFLVNLISGWTVLGWIVCLLWAVTGQTRAADAFYRAQAAKGGTA